VLAGLARAVNWIERRLERLEAQETPRFVPLTTALTSASWDGDSFSDTVLTVIDLSAVFSVPPAVKAVLLTVQMRDSGSVGTRTYVAFGPNNAVPVSLIAESTGLPNDTLVSAEGIVPCDANGDLYYAVEASGVGTLDVWVWVWGYWR